MADAVPAAPPAPAPRRRSWTRRLLRALLVVLLLVALAPLALHLPFVRDALAARASEELGAKVTIGSASGWWTSGVTLTDVVVESPAGHAGRLLTVSRVHAKADLLALVRGAVDATVTVERPHLTLRKNAAGRWNVDDLGRDRAQRPPRPPREGPGPAVTLTLRGGVLEAEGLEGRTERLADVEVAALLGADDALEVTLSARAEKAGPEGGDVLLEASAVQRPGAAAPVRLALPALDLARLSALLERATGLEGLRGTATIDARGEVDAQGRWRGRVTCAAQRLGASTSAGARLAIEELKATLEASATAEGEVTTADVRLTGVEAADAAGPGAHTLSEPEVRFRLAAERGGEERVTVSTLELTAGAALSLRALSPLTVHVPAGGPARVEGRAELAADLARVAALKGFVPALESLRSGRLGASLDGRAGETLNVGLGARLADLDLAPGDLVPGGYADKDVTLQAGLSRDADGTWTVEVHRLQSALVALASAEPLRLRSTAQGALSLSGPLHLALSLGRFSAAFGPSFGLPEGERLGGVLRLKGIAQGGAKDGGMQGALEISDLTLPASWSLEPGAGTFGGQVTVRWGDTRLMLGLAGARGLGLEADATAVLDKGEEGYALGSAQVRVLASLPETRRRLGGLLGLARESTLGGRALISVEATPAPEGTRLAGTTQVSDLAYRAAPADAALEERALTVEHTLLARRGGGLAFERLRLRGTGYLADFSGSSVQEGPDGAVAFAGTLEGDAAPLAERLRAFLGPEHADLRGQGRVGGRLGFSARGPDRLVSGTADVDLALGSWTTAGLGVSDARLRLAREAVTRPYALSFAATVNGGATSVDVAALPEGGRLPWTLKASLAGVDMGTVLTKGKGARHLAFVLPTLVPLDGATPALSGRLTATVDLRADDVGEPLRTRTLAGQGEVALTEGTLAQSSLFGSLGGGGLGDLGQVLTRVAPEVGRELGNLTRAVTYQQVTSKFRVAGEKVEVLEARLLAPAHRLDLSGVVGFDQRVDLAAKLWLGSKAGAELARVVPDQTIPLRVRNTLDKPQVVPDLKASDLLKAAAPALPKPKDLLDDPEKALEKAKKELEERLKGLFPR